MKRTVLFIILLALSALLILSSGCGASKNGDIKKDGNHTEVDDEFTQTDYDVGLVDGYAQGYDQGYSDGGQESYNPEPGLDEDWNEDYVVGYEEGYQDGYEDGYGDAVEDISSEKDETAEVEEAMLTFVKQNAAPGLEFEIENIVIKGNEAVGRAVCTSETLESPYVIMEKGSSGWTAVDFGTGIEPPDWYPY